MPLCLACYARPPPGRPLARQVTYHTATEGRSMCQPPEYSSHLEQGNRATYMPHQGLHESRLRRDPLAVQGLQYGGLPALARPRHAEVAVPTWAGHAGVGVALLF